MTKYVLLTLLGSMLVTPFLFGQANVATLAPIPEEARKHFIMGTTLFKDAKTADDLSQVESEFKQATDLAPQWPDARYNLGLAKEAAGDYSGAMADLKLYQQFKLSDAEARTVQDKIYALEAKAGAAAKKRVEEQKVADAEERKKQNYKDKIGFLEGTWNCHMVTPAPNGRLMEATVKANVKISDGLITFTQEGKTKPFVRGTLQAEDYTAIKWMEADDSNDWDSLDNVALTPAPDTPINVVVDKAGLRIHWQTLQLLVSGTNMLWTPQFGYREYTLTR
jgi:tetratricopeptide (TPR) repeat protein